MIDPTTDGAPSPTLHQLIRSHMEAHGWSYSDLERRSARALSRGRWQQLGSGVPQKKFPDPTSLIVIAQVLDVDITTVVLAAAQAVGLDARPRDSGLARLLPPGTDQLSGRMQDALLTLIRAAVAEAQPGQDAPEPNEANGMLLEWPKSAAPSHRHRNGPADDPDLHLQ
ncbi:hypothetical protein [Pseudonocardia sp. GCM10023141]|uniref:hypothetical protein n=1 Tax=Pseudonocardia sp. GCM10023141 TaxID=3252653 RepID=UPI003611BBE3